MESKPINDIRVGMNSRVRNVVRYCNSILNEKKATDLKFSAIGGAIGRLVNVVEVLRIVNPGLHQTNKIGTVMYQTVDQQGHVQSNRNFPKLEVTLALEEPSEKTDGYQAPLPEDERLKLFELFNERPQRTSFRGGRGQRDSGFRGGRGQRGGFRGGRGQRGGFRGQSRGGFRGQSRGGFRGQSRDFGGQSRGFGGQSRGFGRGNTRGSSRGRVMNRGRGGY